VVIDEQHKFGVLQRQALKAKGRWPHCLVMTATPIPRTLAMTVFGDLDVSVLDEMPPGRMPISTRLARKKDRPEVFRFLRGELAANRRAYIVYPLVEQGENEEIANAEAAYEELRTGELKGFSVGLIHGRMKLAEKEKAMEDFRDGRVQALVATVVIEVGLDVPEATVMIVEHAERFGLAQLHQLRGRIGRGRHASHCILFTDARTEEARARLSVIVRTTDGFQIAEEDLRLRGPGEFFGTRQHGLPPLRIADLGRDTQILIQARQDAFDLISRDPRLEAPRLAETRSRLIRLYAENIDLAYTG